MVSSSFNRLLFSPVMVIVLLGLTGLHALPLTTPTPIPTPTLIPNISTSTATPTNTEAENLKALMAGLGVLKNAVKIPSVYKDVCQFSKHAEMFQEALVSNNSLGIELALEQNINDVCHWMKSELVSESVEQFNCSGPNAAREMKQLCDLVLPYLKLDSIVEEAHRRMSNYTQHPEVSLKVNSTWNEIESQYALNLARSVPQEIAAVLQAI